MTIEHTSKPSIYTYQVKLSKMIVEHLFQTTSTQHCVCNVSQQYTKLSKCILSPHNLMHVVNALQYTFMVFFHDGWDEQDVETLNQCFTTILWRLVFITNSINVRTLRVSIVMLIHAISGKDNIVTNSLTSIYDKEHTKRYVHESCFDVSRIIT